MLNIINSYYDRDDNLIIFLDDKKIVTISDHHHDMTYLDIVSDLYQSYTGNLYDFIYFSEVAKVLCQAHKQGYEAPLTRNIQCSGIGCFVDGFQVPIRDLDAWVTRAIEVGVTLSDVALNTDKFKSLIRIN